MIVEKNFNWGVDLSLGNEMKFDESYSYGKGGKKILLSEFLKEFFLHFGLEYGITGCGVFKAGIQNWKVFCIKINCSQMKLLNFENWTNREPQ